MTLAFTLFIAGVLTILLPCILPLIPIVLGVSIAGRSKWRPLLTVLGMVVSFVGFSFLLLVVLNQFVEVADYMRIATYYVLFLFGVGFLTSNKTLQLLGAVAGGFFFQEKGWIAVTVAQTLGAIAMELGTKVATRIQQFGSNVQQKARGELGENNPITAFIMGLTMGLVWVPCAGPALGFAFTLVREQPGPIAALYLSAYALGTAVPLIIIGYGGQAAVHSVRAISKYSGRIKQVSGALLIITAIAFNFDAFMKLQIWLIENTSFGNLGTDIESRLFGEQTEDSRSSSSADSMKLPNLPKITRAPEFTGLGTWFNSDPLTMEGLKGKVVLVDFWTYSCINCIRTLPYIEGYWEKFKDTPFVLIGVHTPEFVFEKSEKNVADAIKKHGLTYPIVQDNDFGTWRAFANRYWPAKYLIDADGYIRYTHFGEGAYEETDLAIQSLLKEIGVEVTGEAVETTSSGRKNLTPETYMGARSWPSFQNAQNDPSDKVITYTAPTSLELHKYSLVGDWQLIDEERQMLVSDEGEIRMKFLAGEINLVLGLGEGAKPVQIDVEVDGKKTKSFTVDFHDLYNLFTGEYGEHEVTLKIHGKGLEGYAFTFGAN